MPVDGGGAADTVCPMEFSYSDGADVETSIRDLLAGERELGSTQRIAPTEQAHSWPVRYHLAPERANLVRHLCFADLEVLELGAGMGGLSRYLAEESGHLTVVEGSERRLAALRERLRDLDGWTAWQGRIEAFETEARFDVVCVVGVLEYAELHLRIPEGYAGDAYDFFLERATTLLKPDGVLLLAIENRLGLKYWSGAGEDHSGGLFDGIVGYPASPAARTFSRRELYQRLGRQGLQVAEEYFPYPDYKLPNSVLHAEILEADSDLAADLAGYRPFHDPMSRRSVLFPDYLALHSIGKAGLLADLANSFLLAAGRDPASSTLARLVGPRDGEPVLAWHYSPGRRQQVRTLFRRAASGHMKTEKEALGRELVSVGPDLQWTPVGGEVARGERVRLRLLKRLYFGEEESFFEEFRRFFDWLLDHHGDRESSTIRGNALDALVSNALIVPEGFRIFDREWTVAGELRASRLVLRNVISLSMDFEIFSSGLSFGSLGELYSDLCRRLGLVADLEQDLLEESAFQHTVTCREQDEVLQELREMLSRPFSSHELPPRRPDFLWRWQERLAQSGGGLHEAATLVSQQRSISIQSDSISALQRVITTLEQAVEQQTPTIFGQQETLASQQATLSAMQGSLSSQQGTIEELSTALRQESSQLEGARAEAADQKRQVSELDARLQRLGTERDAIQEQLAEASRAMKALERELEASRARVLEIESQLAVERQIVARQIGELATAHRTLERPYHRWIEGLFGWLGWGNKQAGRA